MYLRRMIQLVDGIRLQNSYPLICPTLLDIGNIAIVGARLDGIEKGAAYVFEKNNVTGNWTEVVKLTASYAESGDEFGFSVSVSGNIAIVGAYGHDSRKGAAYVFEKNEITGNWTEVDKLTDHDGAAGDVSGYSVSISGNTAIVGASAYYNDEQKVAAHVFEMDGSTRQWKQTAKLNATDGAASDYFGFSVSISGNVAVVGAHGGDDKGSFSDSAYVFERVDIAGDWNQTAKLTATGWCSE